MRPHADSPQPWRQDSIPDLADTVVPEWREAAPSPSPPVKGEVHLWKIVLDTHTRGHASDPAGVLSPDEQARAERYRLDRDRVRFVTARVALRGILGNYLGLPAHEIEFRYGPRGKPHLADHPADQLHFNFTDSGDLGLLAVGRGRPLGVDMERLRDRRNLPALAARMFPAAEAETIADLTGEVQIEAFYRIWTGFEARVKARGSGIFHPGASSSLETDWRVHHLRPRTDSIAAVAMDRSTPPPHWRAYTWP